jgi:hypothetical protein
MLDIWALSTTERSSAICRTNNANIVLSMSTFNQQVKKRQTVMHDFMHKYPKSISAASLIHQGSAVASTGESDG